MVRNWQPTQSLVGNVISGADITAATYLLPLADANIPLSLRGEKGYKRQLACTLLIFCNAPNHCRWWLQQWNSRCLLFGRKVMTNLESILKSRDITLSTKSQLVKVLVFPVVMYGCESWTIKKVECCFRIWGMEKTLESPLDYKEILKESILKEINPGCSLEGLMLKLKLQYIAHLMWRVDSVEKTLMLGKDWGHEQKGMTEDEMTEWHHHLNEHEFE